MRKTGAYLLAGSNGWVVANTDYVVNKKQPLSPQTIRINNISFLKMIITWQAGNQSLPISNIHFLCV